MNSQGGLTDSYNYSSYGELVQSTGITQNSYLYRGEQFDLSTGLQYLRARYYNPKNGRFNSIDPLEGSLDKPVEKHRYMYGNNNPISYSDPSGKFSVGEAVATIYLSGFAIANILPLAGLGISYFSGGYTQWDGIYVQASPSLPLPDFVGGAFIGAAATRDPSRGKSLTASWGLILGGFSVSVFPLSILGGEFHAVTPSIFSDSPKYLSGPVYYTDVTNYNPLLSNSGHDYSSAFFTMGYGYAAASNDDKTVGFSVDASQLFGISILSES